MKKEKIIIVIIVTLVSILFYKVGYNEGRWDEKMMWDKIITQNNACGQFENITEYSICSSKIGEEWEKYMKPRHECARFSSVKELIEGKCYGSIENNQGDKKK